MNRLTMMRIRGALAGLLTLFVVLLILTISFSHAADPKLEITFSISEEAVNTIAEYRMHVIKDPGSTTMIQVGSFLNTDVTTRVWVDNFRDIPMGRTLDWYLEAIDGEGDSGWSPAFPFKLTGRAIIVNIRHIK